MDKKLRRILELSGQLNKNAIVAGLQENYNDPDSMDYQGSLDGLEGPFKMKNGRVVYYDTKEGKYYDRRTDMYLSNPEADALNEDKQFDNGVIIHATRGKDNISLRLEGMMAMRPMASMLRNNGYDDFEMTGNDGERGAYDMGMKDPDMGQDDMDMGDPLEKIKSSLEQLSSMGELPPEVASYVAKAAQYLDMAAAGEMGMDQDMGMDYHQGMDKEMRGVHEGDESLEERKLSDDEKAKLDRLKKKYENSDMYDNIIDEYGKEKGENIFYGKLTKMAKEGKEEMEPYKTSYPKDSIPRTTQGDGGKLEEMDESKQGRDSDSKMTPSLSKKENKRNKKAMNSKERQKGKKDAMYTEDKYSDEERMKTAKQAVKDEEKGEKKADAKVKKDDDTSKKYKKGDKVIYKSKEKVIVVPNGPTDMVGISDKVDGKVDMVKDSELKPYKQEEVKETTLPIKAIDSTVYINTNMPANAVDDMEQKAERTGEDDRTGVKVKVPAEVISSITKRITELKKSIDNYDKKGYNEKSVKTNSIEALEQIKQNLDKGNHEGFMEAQIYFTTLMSPIWDMFPAQLVNYLAKGSDVGGYTEV